MTRPVRPRPAPDVRRPPVDPTRRRAALIATAVTVPFVVIVAVVLGLLTLRSGRSAPSKSTALPPLTVAAPADAAAQAKACGAVLAPLPVSLGTLAPRVVHTVPDTPYVVAWGDPAVVLSCGVARPAALVPGSSVELRDGGDPVHGPFYVVTQHGGGSVWTTVDRAAYIALTFPPGRQPADYLPILSKAIDDALPAVCSTDSATPDPAKLCTRRK